MFTFHTAVSGGNGTPECTILADGRANTLPIATYTRGHYRGTEDGYIKGYGK